MDRRNFLKTCIALAAAPAIVRAESLMRIAVPRSGLILFGDGIHDDSDALQAWADGKIVRDSRGLIVPLNNLSGYNLLLSKQVNLKAGAVINNCGFHFPELCFDFSGVGPGEYTSIERCSFFQMGRRAEEHVLLQARKHVSLVSTAPDCLKDNYYCYNP